ncbi:hypothetical protein VDG1235_1432 [Verrucomicrobiia bacterium DG1235]|nr:hypothetical protein VDG1235_1432 [Verrucomicrobiae bacterium DG1235]
MAKKTISKTSPVTESSDSPPNASKNQTPPSAFICGKNTHNPHNKNPITQNI